MATVFESLSLKGLRLTHLIQLRDYITFNSYNDCYYAPKKYWIKREQELCDWLDAAIRYAQENNVRFPK